MTLQFKCLRHPQNDLFYKNNLTYQPPSLRCNQVSELYALKSTEICADKCVKKHHNMQ